MKTRIYDNPVIVSNFNKAYKEMYNFIVKTDPKYSTYDDEGFMIDEPVLFEDYIHAILQEQPQGADIDIEIATRYNGEERFGTFDYRAVFRMKNNYKSFEQSQYLVYCIYYALEIGKKVFINGQDITTIDFEY